MQEVPVTVAEGLTEDEIRELRIADNKTNESEWDFEMLSIDAAELDFEGFDFDLGDPFAEHESDEPFTLADEQHTGNNEADK